MPTPADRIRVQLARRARTERSAITRLFADTPLDELTGLGPLALLGGPLPSEIAVRDRDRERANQRIATQASLVDDENAARIRRAGIRETERRAISSTDPRVAAMHEIVDYSQTALDAYRAGGELEQPSWESFRSGAHWAVDYLATLDV